MEIREKLRKAFRWSWPCGTWERNTMIRNFLIQGYSGIVRQRLTRWAHAWRLSLQALMYGAYIIPRSSFDLHLIFSTLPSNITASDAINCNHSTGAQSTETSMYTPELNSSEDAAFKVDTKWARRVSIMYVPTLRIQTHYYRWPPSRTLATCYLCMCHISCWPSIQRNPQVAHGRTSQDIPSATEANANSLHMHPALLWLAFCNYFGTWLLLNNQFRTHNLSVISKFGCFGTFNSASSPQDISRYVVRRLTPKGTARHQSAPLTVAPAFEGS